MALLGVFVRCGLKLAARAPKAIGLLEDVFDDVTTVLTLPERYRNRLRTTNGMERLNDEIRRRERVIRIFPNRASVIRLLGSLLMEIDEKWSSGRKYLDITEYHAWRREHDDEQPVSKIQRLPTTLREKT